MKNEGKRNLYAISAQFRKAGSHKSIRDDKKCVRRAAKEEIEAELTCPECYGPIDTHLLCTSCFLDDYD